MATELEHIELANRNHEALRVLLAADDDHPEWVATIAFYKALQILEVGTLPANSGKRRTRLFAAQQPAAFDDRPGFIRPHGAPGAAARKPIDLAAVVDQRARAAAPFG